MNVSFVGEPRAEWTNHVIGVTHEIRSDPEGAPLVSVIGVANVSSSHLWVPEPLLMPFGADRKSCLRVLDGSGSDLRQLGDHLEFRTDDRHEQVLPYVPLEPDEDRQWSFDLTEHFERLGSEEGEYVVQLTYLSPTDEVSQVDDQGNLIRVSCWLGRAEAPDIRFRVSEV